MDEVNGDLENPQGSKVNILKTELAGSEVTRILLSAGMSYLRDQGSRTHLTKTFCHAIIAK